MLQVVEHQEQLAIGKLGGDPIQQQPFSGFGLSNPERVGSYRLTLPRDIVTAGSNEIIVIPATMTTAGAAGDRFAWLAPDDPVGVRLWYVRVVPTP